MSATPPRAREPGPAKDAGATPKDPQAELDASLTSALVMDKGGYAYVVHPLLDGVPRCPPALLEAWTEWAATQAQGKGATLLLAPEAMGLPLVAPLAMRLGLPYTIIRKRAYHLEGEQVAYCETGYGEACLHINDVGPGDRVLLVDDVLSTGGTLGALLATLRDMQVPVVAALVAVDKGKRRMWLEETYGVPVHAMRTIKVTLQGVEVVRRG